MENFLAGSIMGWSMATVCIVGVIWFFLVTVGEWKLFEKAGRPGWHSLIPFLRDFDLYDMCWMGSMGIIATICSVVAISQGKNTEGFMLTVAAICGVINLVLSVMMCTKLSKSFGKGIGFTLGLIFFQPLFLIILGFSDARYQGKF